MIFVDTMEAGFRGMIMCHLWSDSSIEELHKFAKKLGMKREWYQGDKSGFPHYDISLTKRKIALTLGAEVLDYGSHEWIKSTDKACELHPQYKELRGLRKKRKHERQKEEKKSR